MKYLEPDRSDRQGNFRQKASGVMFHTGKGRTPVSGQARLIHSQYLKIPREPGRYFSYLRKSNSQC